MCYRKATQKGLYRKAIKALTSEGLAQLGPEILEEMLNKHPQAPPPTLPPGPLSSPTLLPESIILRSVKSFPNASAAGPSGLRPSHLREAILCPSPDRAGQILSSLSRFVNLLASGCAPTSVLPGPPYLLAGRKVEATAPSPSGKCFAGSPLSVCHPLRAV